MGVVLAPFAKTFRQQLNYAEEESENM